MITGSTTGIYPLTTIQSFLARATIDPLTDEQFYNLTGNDEI